MSLKCFIFSLSFHEGRSCYRKHGMGLVQLRLEDDRNRNLSWGIPPETHSCHGILRVTVIRRQHPPTSWPFLSVPANLSREMEERGKKKFWILNSLTTRCDALHYMNGKTAGHCWTCSEIQTYQTLVVGPASVVVFHTNLSSGSGIFRYGGTETKQTVAFHNFANAPKGSANTRKDFVRFCCREL